MSKSDIIGFAGVVLVSVGAGMVYVPAGLIVMGGLFITLAVTYKPK